MTWFVDTSAVLAILNADDIFAKPAAKAWREAVTQHIPLATTNYVLLESSALIQRRLGLGALGDYQRHIRPRLRVEWVGREEHDAAMAGLLLAGRRNVSLVDAVSFLVMRRLGLRQTFTFDPHFAEQGFACIPAAKGQ